MSKKCNIFLTKHIKGSPNSYEFPLIGVFEHNMTRVQIDLTETEYLKILKERGNRTNRELLFAGLDAEPEPRVVGRPTTREQLEAKLRADAEERVLAFQRQELLKKINKKNADETRSLLGIDNKKGETTEPLDKKAFKKRR
jgi:hypothetical protein